MSVYVNSYASNSPSAARFASALGATLCTPTKCPVRGSHGREWPNLDDPTAIVNWGSERYPRWVAHNHPNVLLLNTPRSVSMAGNKLAAFYWLDPFGATTAYSIPDYTVDQQEARQWANDGCHVVGRTTYHGSRGNNIVMLDIGSSDRDWQKCVFFVKHIPNVAEYRVHVVGPVAVLAHRKRRRNGHEYQNHLIKNYENGWVFCSVDAGQMPRLRAAARCAVRDLNLHFGAVDIIYNRRQDKYYVLEVNTAPNLTGQSLEVVSNEIKNYIQDQLENTPS